MATPAKPNRDKRTGQYAHEGRWDRLCKCGHTLGEHTAAKVAGEQPCLADECAADCQCFKPAKT